ncbi:MAG: imidazole glycerol phosphate synthase subunit HisH [Nitrospinota bacterium]
MSIVIVDYDVGNLHSVQKGLEKVGATAIVSRDIETISTADAIVLPGVGAFSACVDNLNYYNLTRPIIEFIKQDRPFLGICVGYQLLFESSDESAKHQGFSIIKGKSKKFLPANNNGQRYKVPHMGWNQVRIVPNNGEIFEQIDDLSDFYFVHSFYPVPEDESVVSSWSDYTVSFASSIRYRNIFGLQFHPEKSHTVGLKLLSNFAKLASDHSL